MNTDARAVEDATGFTWRTLNIRTGRIEIVESYPTLAEAIADMARLAWEEPTNRWLDFVVGKGTGEVAATALFGPGLELLVTMADGRRLVFEMPEFYREGRSDATRI